MLHLAQVQNNESVGGTKLQLLARQNSENSWAIINPESIPLPNANSLSEGLLVLVDLSETQEVLDIQSAKDWVLDFVQKYLAHGITPSFLEEEAARSEQWRQDLTLQSQDLTRQRAEMEARRENIQTLESELIPERQQLEEQEAQFKAREEKLIQQQQQLEEQEAKLKAKEEELIQQHQQLEEKEAKLKANANLE
ncbi:MULTISPECIES: hypothetical protein [unclassified Coleofasciculus]|uniref:hypothetical protein n=1 Tax=unclassified Coleofasciculus TaxID=2692782 RepID=UPI001D1506DE|nr:MULTISPECIES: hypothetical protein [unclassified Coleofasciculus]